MKTINAFILSILLSGHVLGQYILETSDLRATINHTGDLFYDINTFDAGFEVPRNSGLHTLYTGQIWLGATDTATGQLVVSAQTYRQAGISWHGGPVSLVYTGFYDSVFYATRDQVLNHKQNFNSPGYQAPSNFTYWPAEGIPVNGEPARMAPFHDENNDGFYNPSDGDHPKVIGGSTAYFIVNDIRDSIPPQGDPCCLGVDVHALYYDLSIVHPDLENTLFMNYKIVNRSGKDYQDFRFGMWLDPDIGFWDDDYVGCDTATEMIFGYNADNNDESIYGYGQNPPAQGLIFLNQDLSAFLTYDADTGTNYGVPNSDQDFYNYMQGLWKDGTPVHYGSNGRDSTGTPTPFIFSGNGWSEESAANLAGDRRMVGSVGPFDLFSGDSLCIQMALLFNRSNGSNNFQNRDNLITQAGIVRGIFDTMGIDCFEPELLISRSSLDQAEKEFLIFPNPARDRITIEYDRSQWDEIKVQVIDQRGNLVMDISAFDDGVKKTLNVASLSNGIYFLKLISENQTSFAKFIKQD